MANLGQTDFSLKPNVDISAIANVLQRKKIAEIEAQQQQRSQKFQELGTTISLASNLASNMVQYSKDRQKQDFVKSLSEAMALTVPEKQMPVQGPTLNGNPLSPISEPDIAKQNLMRSATLVAPDQAAKFAMKTANPANSDDSLSFQRMTLKGSDGKTKTINVGVLGTQLVNPLTKQPFKGTPAEVDSLPEYGFVQREEYAGTDQQGNPVFRNPVAGTTYTKDSHGNTTIYQGPIMPKLQNPSDAMAEKVQFISETRANLKDAIDRFEPEFVGPVAGRVGSLRKYFDSLTDDKQEQFRAFMSEIDTIKRHELFGSALTSSEQKFFKDVSLDMNISPKAFLARLKAAERKLENKENAIMKSARMSGKVLRQTDERPSLDEIFGDGE